MSTVVCRRWFATASLSIATLFAACGGSTHTPGDRQFAASIEPGTRAPSGPLEEELLRLANADSTGQPLESADKSARLGAQYHAASGRQCRRVRFASDLGRDARICKMQGGWQFVPEVFLGAKK